MEGAGAQVDCPVCGPTTWKTELLVGDYEYVACRACGIVRLEPLPTAEQAASLYGDGYFTEAEHGGYIDYEADAPVHRRNGRARLRKLGPPDTPGETLVDLGCAHGFTMIEARAVGWSPVGVDVNAGARAAVNGYGMVSAATLAQLELADGSVGAALLCQSLEHMTDPGGTLRAVASLLRPGGRVLIETWERQSLVARLLGQRWQQASPPSVVWLFSRHDVDRLLRGAGLTMTSYRRSAKWVSVGLIAGQLGRSGRRTGGLAKWIRKLPVPYALGDLVTSTARSVAVVQGSSSP